MSLGARCRNRSRQRQCRGGRGVLRGVRLHPPSASSPDRETSSARPFFRPWRRRVQRSLERFFARPRAPRGPRGSGNDRPALRAAQTEPAREPRALAASRSLRGPTGRNAHAAALRPSTSSSPSGRRRAGERRRAATGRADAAADTRCRLGIRHPDSAWQRTGTWQGPARHADGGERPLIQAGLALSRPTGGRRRRPSARGSHEPAPRRARPRPGRSSPATVPPPALSVRPRPPSSAARAPVAAHRAWLRTVPGL